MLLQDLTMLTTHATTVARRITGSTSMKIGIVPDVSVTIVDDNRIRLIPEARITRPA